MTRRPAITIAPAGASDIPALISVFLAGYVANLYWSLAYRGDKTSLIRQFAEQLSKGIGTPGVGVYKAVETRRGTGDGVEEEVEGEIVGWALWVRRPTGEGPGVDATSMKSCGRSDLGMASSGEGTKDLGKVKEERITTAREKWVKGHDVLVLELLVVRPDRQRLGIGTRLLAIGTKQADKEGISAWLEATPAGHGLYDKHGFNEVGSTDLDLSEWAGKYFGYGIYRLWFMLRLPKSHADVRGESGIQGSASTTRQAIMLGQSS